ncbi:hypothetical protein [Paenibacillus agaridevorans]|uniref:hypothetical protein n=1 Tax=Paenibacillus agaridevorans TaxID=171404 RepID=UPI001BE4DD75|nr:hypothetical protein [Paenibacillus agaridevorans]
MEKTIEVKPSTGFVPVFVFLFFMYIQIYLFIRTEPGWGSLLLLFIISILIAFSAVVAYLLNAIIMNKKPAQLHIHQSSLELFGRRIEEDECMEALKHWAMKQGITVKYKRFPRWF